MGNGGNIAHYDGTNWTKINSGTTVDLMDVWGGKDGKVIWACGYNSNYALTTLVKISNSTVTKIYEGSPNEQSNNIYVGLIGSCWFYQNKYLYLTNGQEILRKEINSNEFNIESFAEKLSDLIYSIRGNGRNDIWAAGQNGLVGHYNGYSIKEYTETKKMDDVYYSSGYKTNTYICVGFRYTSVFDVKAIITIGKKQ